jgi:MinD-like ATPase involved in chromosome partitioning or flagellar assembly
MSNPQRDDSAEIQDLTVPTTSTPQPGQGGADPAPPPPGPAPRHLEPEGLSEKTSLINRDELLAGPQGPRGPRPDWGPGWGPRPGAPGDFSFANDIRSSELVPTRKIPPQRGWRKALYSATFHLINPGQSPDERHQAELVAKVRSLLRGRYKIGVLGKGGVGKTTIAACVGSMLAEMRPDDRVVAIDADTAFGKLASRIDPKASGSYWELAGDRSLHTFADVRSRVGSNPSGLFVLAGEMSTARRRVLDPAVYRAATAQLDKHFTVSIVDCGATMDSPVTRAAIADLDALIVVSSCWYDGASAAGQILEWLANNGYTGLLHRTVVVVNNSDNQAGKRDVKLLVERFGSRGQRVIEMPYDRHLRPAGVIDIDNELTKLSRRRLLELAAALAEHFAATTDRPRERR